MHLFIYLFIYLFIINCCSADTQARRICSLRLRGSASAAAAAATATAAAAEMDAAAAAAFAADVAMRGLSVAFVGLCIKCTFT